MSICALFLLCAQCKQALEGQPPRLLDDDPVVIDLKEEKRDPLHCIVSQPWGQLKNANSFSSQPARDIRQSLRHHLFAAGKEGQLKAQLGTFTSKDSKRQQVGFIPVEPAEPNIKLVDVTWGGFSLPMFQFLLLRAEQVSPLSHAPRRASRSSRVCVVSDAQLMLSVSSLIR